MLLSDKNIKNASELINSILCSLQFLMIRSITHNKEFMMIQCNHKNLDLIKQNC